MNTHDIEPLKYGGDKNDDYVTGWNDCYAAIEADRKRRDEPVALMREAALHLTNWLDMGECECEGPVHQCGRTQVERCRDRLLDAAPQSAEPTIKESLLVAEPVKAPGDDTQEQP